MSILIATICAVAIIGSCLLAIWRWYSAPTKGPQINRRLAKGTALLIVNAQSDLLSENRDSRSSYPNKAKMIVAINKLINHAEKKGWQIIYIKQEFPNKLIRLAVGNILMPDSPGADIDRRIRVVNSNIITKNRADAFSVPMLDDFLQKWSIGQLVICGVDGLADVYKTAQGGVNRGYKLNVVSEAIGTRPAKTHKQLEAIYKKYNIKLVSLAAKH